MWIYRVIEMREVHVWMQHKPFFLNYEATPSLKTLMLVTFGFFVVVSSVIMFIGCTRIHLCRSSWLLCWLHGGYVLNVVYNVLIVESAHFKYWREGQQWKLHCLNTPWNDSCCLSVRITRGGNGSNRCNRVARSSKVNSLPVAVCLFCLLSDVRT